MSGLEHTIAEPLPADWPPLPADWPPKPADWLAGPPGAACVSVGCCAGGSASRSRRAISQAMLSCRTCVGPAGRGPGCRRSRLRRMHWRLAPAEHALRKALPMCRLSACGRGPGDRQGTGTDGAHRWARAAGEEVGGYRKARGHDELEAKRVECVALRRDGGSDPPHAPAWGGEIWSEPQAAALVIAVGATTAPDRIHSAVIVRCLRHFAEN